MKIKRNGNFEEIKNKEKIKASLFKNYKKKKKKIELVKIDVLLQTHLDKCR